MKKLNEEIEDTAGKVAKAVGHSPTYSKGKRTHVESIIGRQLTQLLSKEARNSTWSSPINRFLVKIAIQIFLVHWIANIV